MTITTIAIVAPFELASPRLLDGLVTFLINFAFVVCASTFVDSGKKVRIEISSTSISFLVECVEDEVFSTEVLFECFRVSLGKIVTDFVEIEVDTFVLFLFKPDIVCFCAELKLAVVAIPLIPSVPFISPNVPTELQRRNAKNKKVPNIFFRLIL